MSDDLKKKELLAALADLDGAAEHVIEALKLDGGSQAVAKALDRARFWPEAVRDAVNAVRKERGDVTDEDLMHEAIRRINQEFTDGTKGWEVKHWREVDRLETGERVFEVELLGVELPVDGEELIRAKLPEEPSGEGQPSDFCQCAHTRGSHLESEHWRCVIDGCGCEGFRLLAAGVEGIEEPPLVPGEAEKLNPDVVIEKAAIRFWREMEHEASLDEADAATWMALQRLIDAGWRFLPPPEES
jgi:hypothetical protein